MKKLILCISIITIIALFMTAGCGGSETEAQQPSVDTAPETIDQPGVPDTPSDAQPPEEPGAPDAQPEPPAAPQIFTFEAYGQQINISMEAAPLLDKLPEPNSIFEQPSCAFDGIDITYFYPGFELTTYPENGKEHVLSVVFSDDSITTPEGIYLGGSIRDVPNAYGPGYTQDGNRYIYTNGRENLIFMFEDDMIMGIIYTLIIDE